MSVIVRIPDQEDDKKYMVITLDQDDNVVLGMTDGVNEMSVTMDMGLLRFAMSQLRKKKPSGDKTLSTH